MKNALRSLLSLTLALTLVFANFTVFATDGSAKDEIPYISHDTSIADRTYDSNIEEYYGQGGVDAGVPEGFSGYVIKLTPNTDGGHAGVCVDFSDQNIAIDSIEKISFRVYIPAGGDSELRIVNKAKTSSWIVRAKPSAFSAWVDVELGETSGFEDGFSLKTLANSDGNLGSFCIVFRLKGSKSVAYIDSINIKYKPGVSDDKTPPVINYNGPSEFTVSEGSPFVLDGVSAYDEYDGSASPISYEWSSGAVNGLGELQAGTHTCKVTATDRSGNVSYITITVTAKGDPSVIKLDSIPFTNYIEGVSIYDATVTDLTSDEAALRGVPEGYSGNVLEVKGSGNRFGMTFDPRSLGLYHGLIERITFRFYFRESDNAIRMSDHGATDWTVLARANAGQWMEYSLYADGTGFSNRNNFASLADENGNLDVFGIGTKYATEKNYTFYIDNVIIKLKDDNGKAPVLNYSGETDIITSAGKLFEPGITAFDELEGRFVQLRYDWSAGAITEDGKMIEGEHTCVVSATGYYGHTSSITMNVTVGPPDTEAPEILFKTSEIYVPVGTFNRMVISCVDNYDDVKAVEEWSEGAVDFGGRLYAGTHTLTITATDLSGNVSVHVVTVHVTDEHDVGTLIECGK